MTLCIIDFMGTYGVSDILWSDDVYRAGFTGSDFDEYISSVRTIDLIRYVLIPVYLAFKTLAVAIAFYVTLLLCREEVAFGDLWWVSAVAEMALVMADIVKVLWFVFLNPAYTVDELREFQPLSLAQITGLSGDWTDMPLKMLSVWHIFYMIVWFLGFRYLGFEKRMAIIYAIGIYLLVFFFWIVFRLYVGLNFS